ncbi:anti-sigma factor family protein [Desulfocurvus sp. DL9XJH121]
MDCTTARDKMHAWLDGELPPAEARAMKVHVGGCAECAVRARELSALFDALGGLPGPGHDQSLVEATLRAAEAEAYPPPAQWWAALPVFYKGTSFAAVAAGLLLGIFLFNASPLAPDAATAYATQSTHQTLILAAGDLEYL